MQALNIPAELARRAHQGTSFDPEGRGAREVAGHESRLAADLATLRAHAEKGGTLDQLEAEASRYVAGYRRRVVAYLASASRCVSSFIAGPSNFPARRMQKRADVAHRRLSELEAWRDEAMKAAARNLRPDLRPIMAGDADACERLAAELANAEAQQERMKAANATIRAHLKAGPEAMRAALLALGFSDRMAAELMRADPCHGLGFASYQLTNNSANIRRMRQRLEQLQAAKAAPVVQREGANGITLEDDPPANRVRLMFPGKPAEAVRARLKGGGFRWAPSAGAWQAYRNTRTLELARAMASGEA